jgi:hypothetical protein
MYTTHKNRLIAAPLKRQAGERKSPRCLRMAWPTLMGGEESGTEGAYRPRKRNSFVARA